VIHAIGVAMQSRLRARGVPFVVVDGPEERANAGTFARERIVIERDTADTFRAGRGTKQNPARGAWFREVGCVARIFARSPRAGALSFEHYERAEHVLDHVLVALDEVVRGDRKEMLTVTGGGFVPLDDVAASERVAGAVYELRFSVERGVYAETWAGEARPEATIGGDDGVAITTSPRRVSVDGSDVETF
jgi:hypothetical protein